MQQHILVRLALRNQYYSVYIYLFAYALYFANTTLLGGL